MTYQWCFCMVVYRPEIEPGIYSEREGNEGSYFPISLSFHCLHLPLRPAFHLDQCREAYGYGYPWVFIWWSCQSTSAIKQTLLVIGQACGELMYTYYLHCEVLVIFVCTNDYA